MFLSEPPPSPAREDLYQADRDDGGYVDNLTRAWAWRPDVTAAFARTRSTLMESWSLTDVDRAVLVVATARARGDSYCSLAWGRTLAGLVGEDVASRVIAGDHDALEDRGRALSAWAEVVVRDPNALTAADVDGLRAVGLDDAAIFEATTFVALRLAFSTVNDALGVEPDEQLGTGVPEAVRAAVSYGRPPATVPST